MKRRTAADKRSLQKGADMKSEEDVLGSYTGICTEDCYEKPVQDADDLLANGAGDRPVQFYKTRLYAAFLWYITIA